MTPGEVYTRMHEFVMTALRETLQINSRAYSTVLRGGLITGAVAGRSRRRHESLRSRANFALAKRPLDFTALERNSSPVKRIPPGIYIYVASDRKRSPRSRSGPLPGGVSTTTHGAAKVVKPLARELARRPRALFSPSEEDTRVEIKPA